MTTGVDTSPLFLGLDLSTQALKASLLDQHLAVLSELEVRFDSDLAHYGTRGGVLPPQQGEPKGTVVGPVMMYVEAMDEVAQKMQQHQWPLDRIRGVSAAGQQHASVYFSRQAPDLLTSLSPSSTLHAQLPSAFSRTVVPNWQDSSTAASCAAFEGLYTDGPHGLARVTGSKAHTRFTGPQIHAWRSQNPEQYDATERIALVSSFVTTLLCAGSGADKESIIKPIDESDACGMNLWDMRTDKEREAETRGAIEPGWNWELLRLASGELDSPVASQQGGAVELERKLGTVARDTGAPVGRIGSWWVERYNFHPSCQVFPGTGDNPATFLAFSLAEREAIVSLGTSDTVMVSTKRYVPHPEFHAFVHPAQSGASGKAREAYFNMLVYKSGSLAREWVRDEFCDKSWDEFNKHVEENGMRQGNEEQRIGFYWLRPEIIPAGASGLHRYVRAPSASSFDKVSAFPSASHNAPAILETQFLNYRSRSSAIISTPSSPSSSSSTTSEATLRTLYAVGGASSNPTICQTLADVFGSPVVKPVQRSDSDPNKWVSANYNFCSVGAAYKAAWGYARMQDDREVGFDAFIKMAKEQAQKEVEEQEARGGVQVIATPRKERTKVYDEVVGQWRELENRAVRGE